MNTECNGKTTLIFIDDEYLLNQSSLCSVKIGLCSFINQKGYKMNESKQTSELISISLDTPEKRENLRFRMLLLGVRNEAKFNMKLTRHANPLAILRKEHPELNLPRIKKKADEKLRELGLYDYFGIEKKAN